MDVHLDAELLRAVAVHIFFVAEPERVGPGGDGQLVGETRVDAFVDRLPGRVRDRDAEGPDVRRPGLRAGGGRAEFRHGDAQRARAFFSEEIPAGGQHQRCEQAGEDGESRESGEAVPQTGGTGQGREWSFHGRSFFIVCRQVGKYFETLRNESYF